MNQSLREARKPLPIDWQNTAIPSIPSIAFKLMSVLSSEEISPGEVSELIRQDPALTVKVLRAVNSAFYALNTEVTSVRHATVLLGSTEVLRIALASVLAERFLDVPQSVKHAATRLWEHSVAVALLVQDFPIEGGDVLDLYTLGLLHDIGWLVILSQATDLYNSLMEEKGIEVVEMEEAWGINHRDWGAKFASIWELPEPFQVVAANHHDPLSVIAPPDYLLFVTLANHLAHRIGFKPLECNLEPMDTKILQRLNLEKEEFKEMEEAAIKEKEKIELLIANLIR